jgi:hypothetical protein
VGDPNAAAGRRESVQEVLSDEVADEKGDFGKDESAG